MALALFCPPAKSTQPKSVNFIIDMNVFDRKLRRNFFHPGLRALHAGPGHLSDRSATGCQPATTHKRAPANSASPQQPGISEQVHTGTTSGLDADARLQNLLADHQFQRIEAQLDQMPPQSAQLYRGILANRFNDPKNQSIYSSLSSTKSQPAATRPKKTSSAKPSPRTTSAPATGPRPPKPIRRSTPSPGPSHPRRAGRNRDAAQDLPLAADDPTRPSMTVDPATHSSSRPPESPRPHRYSRLRRRPSAHLDARPNLALQSHLPLASQRGRPQCLRANPPPSTPSLAAPSDIYVPSFPASPSAATHLAQHDRLRL